MKTILVAVGALALCVIAGFSISGSPSAAESHWNPKTAAAYLDQRAAWWIAWPTAARDRETVCISCHTAVPYALARPALRMPLAETAPSANERRLLDSVTKRVRLWKEVEPFYSDEMRGAYKTAESRGTEAVLNALILASYDSPSGKLSADAHTAFDNMWALQLTIGDGRGAWSWLRFKNEPWEADDSQFYGAALAAIATGAAPENYHANPAIQENLKILREYLQRESARQSFINRVVLLWASARLPGLLAVDQQKSLIEEVARQQQEDGGWNTASLVGPWKRHDDTPLDMKSDGYATGLVTLAWEEAGVLRDDPRLKRGLSWLARNQNPAQGQWPAYSLNNGRNPFSPTGRFMSDAATAYAVLALTRSNTR